jgi:pimeloyl-ACP methyl ester carboxylesterase
MKRELHLEPAAAPVRHYTAPDGCRIAFRDTGPADAPPIFFCTMATAALTVWDPIAAPLALSHRIILHDRRGNGNSDPGAPDSHTFNTFVDDALGVLNTLGIGEAAICGMAFGARVALHLALRFPEQTRKLILFDATGGPPAPEALRRAGSEEAARLRALAGLPALTVLPEWFYRRDPAGDGLNGAALRGQPAWIPGLAALQRPTLVACGDHDPNLEGARRLASEIHGAQLVIMPMTGHASILDRPDLVLSIVQAFLK